MAEGIFSAANIGFAIFTQGFGAVVSGVQGAKDSYDQDKDICHDLNNTIDATNKISSYTDRIKKADYTMFNENGEFAQLVKVMQGEKSIIQSRKKSFSIRILTTIIVNIVLTLFITFQLFY